MICGPLYSLYYKKNMKQLPLIAFNFLTTEKNTLPFDIPITDISYADRTIKDLYTSFFFLLALHFKFSKVPSN